LIEFLPSLDWPPNTPLRSRWSLPLESRTPGGDYHLQLTLIDETGTAIRHDLGAVTIPGRVRNFVAPAAIEPVEAVFADELVVSGFKLEPDALNPGQTLSTSLIWLTTAPLSEDYTVFLQLLNANGEVIAQQDKQPLDGQAPTSSWTPGEIVVYQFLLPLPAELPPGEYRLITGFYQFETGQRLLTEATGAEADSLLLKSFQRK
jgi:hypothetical protein